MDDWQTMLDTISPRQVRAQRQVNGLADFMKLPWSALRAKDRYGCAAHRQKGTCTNDRTILRHEIEVRVRPSALMGAIGGARQQGMPGGAGWRGSIGRSSSRSVARYALARHDVSRTICLSERPIQLRRCSRSSPTPPLSSFISSSRRAAAADVRHLRGDPAPRPARTPLGYAPHP